MPVQLGEAVSLTASFMRLMYDSNGYCIIKIVSKYEPDKFPQGYVNSGNGITARGRFMAPSYQGQKLELAGSWNYDAKYKENVFLVSYVIPSLPKTEEDAIPFLQSIKGIGKTLAGRISKCYNGDMEIAGRDEDVLVASVKGVTKPKAAAVCEAVRRLTAIADMTMLLKEHVEGEVIHTIAARYGEQSLEVVKTAPYKMAIERTVKFPDADSIGLFLGWSKEDKYRLSTGIVCCMRNLKMRTASVIIDKAKLRADACELLTVDEMTVDQILLAMQREKKIVSAGKYWYAYEDYQTEKELADKIVAFCTTVVPPQIEQAYLDKFKEWEKCNQDIKLAENQEKAVKVVANNVLSVLTGGPGTGKTSTLKAIIDTYKMAFPNSNITLMAPTGLAAKRMSEACGMEAGTIHRVLGLIPSENETGFDDSMGMSIDGGLVIIDEFSMVGIHLAKHLMDAIVFKPDVRIIIVGDIDQLPPVSPGAILRDLIECGKIKVTLLNRNFRQEAGSAIVDAAYAINSGDICLPYNKGNFQYDEISDQDIDAEVRQILEHLKSAFADSIKTYGLDQTYVLAPQRRAEVKDGKTTTKTLLSTSSLNPILRDIANPEGAGKAYCKAGGKVYRIGDRVINLKNTPEVMNGEIGIIAKIENSDATTITVDFDGVLVEYTPDRFRELDLAYAITVHKSQGCEYASVLYPTSMTQSAMLQRNLLYTAITRAKKNVVLIGSKQSINTAITRVNKRVKRDLLGPRIVRYCEQKAQDRANMGS